jgi:hypothetical protein
MFLKLFTVCLIVWPGLFEVYAQNHVQNEKIRKEVQDNWIMENKRMMMEKGNKMEWLTIEPQVTAYDTVYRISYRLQGKGMVQFGNGKRIFMVSNSAHDNAAVGDITLAMDEHGKLYKNHGHICGGLVSFIINGKSIRMNPVNFFRYAVSDTDDLPWIKLEKRH